MKDEILAAIQDLGAPSTVYVHAKQDLILIQDIEPLHRVQVVINPIRYEKETVTIRFASKRVVFRPRPQVEKKQAFQKRKEA